MCSAMRATVISFLTCLCFSLHYIGRIAADYASQHIRELILSHSVNSSKKKERAVCSSPVDIAASERSSSPQGSLSSGSKHLSSEHSNFSLLSSQRSLSPFNSNIERSALDYGKYNYEICHVIYDVMCIIN